MLLSITRALYLVYDSSERYTACCTVGVTVDAGFLVRGCHRNCQDAQSLSPPWHAAEIPPMGCQSQRLCTYQPIHCEISRPGQP